jgi:periplasmic protein TonB
VTGRALGWWIVASVTLHAGMLAVASLGAPSMDLSPRPAVAIEVVQQAPPPPPPPPPPPKPRPVPRAVTPPLPAPKPVPTAQETPNLLDAPAPTRPMTAPSLAGSLVPSPLASATGPVIGAPAGAGRLFAGGDLLVPPGPSGSAGSSTGSRGVGQAPAGATTSQVAASGTGLTALARPLGGYQIKPEYPETALRDQAQGITVVRFEVLATGRVGEVQVTNSAGHRDLDRATTEAVKQWRFEPARRGATAVTVWVTLPFTFTLPQR